METDNYICNSTTYAYSKGYIGLPINIENLPETISIEGETLYLRTSFHVSLVCVKNILEKLPNKEKEVIDEFCNFSQENEISLVDYTGEFRLAEDGERKSLVVLCEVSNLSAFTDKLNERFGNEIPYQPTHVTLYTLQPDIGIGLNSSKEMTEKSYQVEAPDEITRVIAR